MGVVEGVTSEEIGFLEVFNGIGLKIQLVENDPRWYHTLKVEVNSFSMFWYKELPKEHLNLMFYRGGI